MGWVFVVEQDDFNTISICKESKEQMEVNLVCIILNTQHKLRQILGFDFSSSNSELKYNIQKITLDNEI